MGEGKFHCPPTKDRWRLPWLVETPAEQDPDTSDFSPSHAHATPRCENMTAAQERALLERWHLHGDERARSELVERPLPFVRRIASGYVGRGAALDDLMQVGSLGLVKAIDRFDLDRGLRLTTFAAPNISGEIKRHFRDRRWSVRVPRQRLPGLAAHRPGRSGPHQGPVLGARGWERGGGRPG